MVVLGGFMDRPGGITPEATPSWSELSRRRSSFYLIAALLLATLAGLLSYRFLQRIRLETLPSTRALVARVDIEPGTVIEPSMVVQKMAPEAFIPSNALTGISEAVGRETFLPIEANEILLGSRLAGGNLSRLSAKLAEGRWALVLPGSWLASPLPELIAGDRIDILAYTQSISGETGGLLVQGIQILAVSGSNASPDAVTISVSMTEAESILVARVNGFLMSALLRSTGG
jgi:Flp pilus assembly protein CpaB